MRAVLRSALLSLGALVLSACNTLPPLAPVMPSVIETLPPSVAREQHRGQVTIVEFMDFGCPACRRQHVELTRALDRYGDRVRLVRKHRPLAEDTAARGYACADTQGYAEPMADALYTAASLDQQSVVMIASQLGLDVRTFQRCTYDRGTSWKMQRDLDASEEASIQRLPTLFVNNERYDGITSESQLRAAIDRMLSE